MVPYSVKYGNKSLEDKNNSNEIILTGIFLKVKGLSKGGSFAPDDGPGPHPLETSLSLLLLHAIVEGVLLSKVLFLCLNGFFIQKFFCQAFNLQFMFEIRIAVSMPV